MSIEKFYTFSSKLSSSTVQAHPISLSDKEDNAGLFDQHRLIQGVYDGIFFPVTFKQEYGKKLEDVLDTGWPSLFLISDKMKAVLEENAFTGWKNFVVKVLDKKGQEIQGYHGLSITGRCGKINYNKSEIIEKRLVPNAPLVKYYKGLPVDLNKWDTSDFFLPEKYFGIIITGRAAEVLKKSKVTNIKLENIIEVETPYLALQNQ
ncbi:hypothetical protein J2T02_004702 [Chitinophaga terrae (ex Kim and Jung 2007)]|jgi:hypothetical protein|uniref:hypothetical protein n=1 Tax=Chitinophaga terrae (ex Kim and Jung 2007) TaxID=408074 RepID=UPI00278695EB|nr:hypothetical protein [Chitinophaga terrae (ex Kim and Jung 2007)]MDQ0109558.1 hypothetical protein [Chitinophaga terrae (ex Kim and Jung 2007)]